MTDQRRIVAITGGAGGIGMAAAEALVTDGYAVALLDCAEEALERQVNTRVAMSTKHYQQKEGCELRQMHGSDGPSRVRRTGGARTGGRDTAPPLTLPPVTIPLEVALR